jgi:hypothetical protein
MAGLVPAIHVLTWAQKKDVDARHEAGHDDRDFRRVVISDDENTQKRNTAVDNVMTPL